MSNIIATLEKERMQRQVPDFGPGDTVVAEVKVKEGDRERVQAWQASNQASDEQGALGESTAMEVPEYLAQCKKRARDGRVASDGDR